MTIKELTNSLENISVQIRIAEETTETVCAAASDGSLIVGNAAYVLQGIENTLKVAVEDMEEAISGAMELTSRMEQLLREE